MEREGATLGGLARKETDGSEERERERGERREWREAGLDGEEEVEVSSAKAGRAPGRHTASSPLCSATRMLRRVCPWRSSFRLCVAPHARIEGFLNWRGASVILVVSPISFPPSFRSSIFCNSSEISPLPEFFVSSISVKTIALESFDNRLIEMRVATRR